MRVACPECSAEYEFSSTDIPPDGYDAQCTNCSAVFFVAPVATNPGMTVPIEPVVTIDCPGCAARYQFPASEIPAGGYEAKCTQCGEVFFVAEPENSETSEDVSVASTPEEPPSTGEEDVPSPSSEELAELPDASSAMVELPQIESAGFDSAVTEQVPFDGLDSDGLAPIEDLAAEVTDTEKAERFASDLDADFEDNTGVDDESMDFELGGKGRARWVWGFLAVAVIGFAAAGVWWVTRSAEARSEAFLAQLADGQGALRLDTDLGYQSAVGHFRSALELSPGDAEAGSYLALAKFLWGANVEERGRFLQVHAEWLRGSSKKNGARRESSDPLRSKNGAALLAESKALLETGKNHISEGFERLKQVLGREPPHRVALDAASVYYGLTQESLSRSKEYVEQSAVGGPGSEGSAGKFERSRWAVLALSRVKVGLDSDLPKAIELLQQLMKREPNFYRARFQLAELYLGNKQIAEAKQAVQGVLDRVSDHERAKLWMEHLERLPSSDDAKGKDDPDASLDAAASKRKKKKRRGRRRGRRKKR